jgi:hypothetical protein
LDREGFSQATKSVAAVLVVAGYEQNVKLRAQCHDLIGELQAIHSGHQHIAEQQRCCFES